MYGYVFDHWYGRDRVVKLNGLWFLQGDIIYSDGMYILLLGETIAHQQLYTHELDINSYHSIEWSFLSHTALKMIHHFVYYRYTSYKNTIPLRLDEDIDTILKRKISHKPKKQSSTVSILKEIQEKDFYYKWDYNTRKQTLHQYLDTVPSYQRLVVFPSVRVMYNSVQIEYFNRLSWYLLLSGSSTSKQKQEAFRSIKSGKTHTILATGSQIFHDYYHLDEILVSDQHSRHYKSQQDPRYHTVHVCDSLATIYQANIVKIGLELT